MRRFDLSGKVFGRLTAVAHGGRDKHGRRAYRHHLQSRRVDGGKHISYRRRLEEIRHSGRMEAVVYFI